MRYLNHIAALLGLLGTILIAADFYRIATTPPRTRVVNGRYIINPNAPEPSEALIIAGYCIALPGSLWLMIDSFRRKYQGNATPVWFTTIFGLVFPPLSFLYYLIRGRTPLAAERHGTAFCRDCLTESSPESAGNTFTFNFLYGTRLIGSARPCPHCGSTIKTKWLLIGFPLIPLGSYRVIFTYNNEYLSRRIPPHKPHFVLGLSLTALFILLSLIILLAKFLR